MSRRVIGVGRMFTPGTAGPGSGFNTPYIVKLDENFDVEWTEYNSDFSNTLTRIEAESVEEILDDSGNSKGYIITGLAQRKLSPTGVPSSTGKPESKGGLYIATVGNNGSNTFSIQDEVVILNTDLGPNPYQGVTGNINIIQMSAYTRLTKTPCTEETERIRSYEIVQADNENVYILAMSHEYFSFLQPDSGCDYGSVGGEDEDAHKEGDAFVVKIDFSDFNNLTLNNSNFTTIQEKYITHFSGVDFLPRIHETDDGNLFLSGTNADNLNNDGTVIDPNNIIDHPRMSLVKIDYDMNILWERKFLGSAGSGACAFASTPTTDGGYLLVGNNAASDNTLPEPNSDFDRDDFLVVKLYSDCHPNHQTYTIGFEPNVNSVSGSGTWSGSMQIGAEVVVGNGQTLTISTGTRVEFADTRQLNDYYTLASNIDPNIKRAGITVEPGGTLIIEDAVTLKGLNACGEDLANGVTGNNMWEGIEVLSDLQTGAIGQVIINGQNNGSIRDALVGIRAAKLEYNQKGEPFSVYNKNNFIVGGSLDIDGAVFRNNQIDVDIVGPYHPYLSLSNYPTFDFQNNAFLSTDFLADPNFIDEDCERMGNQIHVNLRSTERVTFIENNFFQNAYRPQEGYGVKGSLSSARIQKNNHFESMEFGIHAIFSNFYQKNYFSIEGEPFDGTGIDERNQFINNEFGTYLLGTPTNFIFANNHLDYDDPSPSYYAYGLYLDGTERYLVHHNEFSADNVTIQRVVGIFANNTGHVRTNPVRDNIFTNMNSSIAAYRDNGKERPDGGLEFRCNDFNQDNSNTGYWDVLLLEEEGGGIDGSVQYVQGTLIPLENDNSNFNQHVSAPAGNRFSTCGLQAESHIGADVAHNFEYTHHKTNIGGNILIPSCYDNVVVQLNDGEAQFTNGVSCEQIANKKAALSAGTLKNEIDAQKTEIALLEQMPGNEEEIAYLKSERFLGIHVLLEDYFKNENYSLAISFLESEMTTEADMALIPLYISQQDYTKATAKIAAFSSHTSNLQAYKDLATIGLNLAMNNLGYADINSTQETSIRAIANGNTSQAAKAKGILFDAYGETYLIDKPVISNGSSKRANLSLQEENNQVITFAPNPAQKNLHVHWNAEVLDISQIIFYDLVGKVMAIFDGNKEESSIDVSKWQNGLYIAKVRTSDNIVKTHKILINR